MYDFRRRALPALLVSSILVAGCAAPQCGDPRYDGLGTAFACQFGGYERQTDELRQEAQVAQTRAAALRQENAMLNARSAALSEEERRLTARLQELNENLARQHDRLAELLAQERINREQYEIYESELRSLEERRAALDTGDADETSRRIDRINADIERLRQFLDDAATLTVS